MLLHDAALERLHVVLAVDRAGLVGSDGETHHGVFDALFLPTVPGMTVLCPASFAELRRMLREAVLKLDGPVAVRYPRGGEGRYQADSGPDAAVRLRDGGDITLAAYGVLINQALEAADILNDGGIRAGVVKLNRIAPLSYEDLAPVLGGCRRLAVIEDCCGSGCVGQRVCGILSAGGTAPEQVLFQNLGGQFVPAGSVSELRHSLGLDGKGIAEAVFRALA